MSQRRLLQPKQLLLSAAFVCVAVCASTVYFALRSAPWLGLSFALDEQGQPEVVQGKGPSAGLASGSRIALVDGAGTDRAPMELEAMDIVEEPDFFDDYATINRFFARQEQLHALLSSPALHLRVVDRNGAVSERAVRPGRRPLSDLPPVFWFQLLAGASGFLIAAWVYATSPANLAARCFLVLGTMFLGFTAPAALYGTRELALGAGPFRALGTLNHVCAFAFGGGLVALFLCYPRRLLGSLGIWLVIGIFAPWCLLDVTQTISPDAGYRSAILLEQLTAIALAGVQWFVTRDDPRARAELRWLGTSVLLGAGLFVFCTAGMSMLGLTPPFAQGYAFGFFSLMYVGFALGLRRHRLLGLDEWAYRVLVWVCAAVLLIVLDLLMVLWLGGHPAMSLGAALLVSGFFYMPIRNWLWNRTVSVVDGVGHELFEGVIQSAFAGSSEAREQRWVALLQRHFEPAEIHRPKGTCPESVIIADDGVGMFLPATAGLPALKLTFPWRGRGLFELRHLQLATTLVSLMRQAESAREAYARGVLAERQRIARDLHDNLGARLLSGLYAESVHETREGIRHAISDMRSIVQELMTDQAYPLVQLLGDLRHEAADRVRAANLVLDWPEPDVPPDTKLTPATVRSYTAILRELLSNTLRHAAASRVAVQARCIEGMLETTYSDDGVGMTGTATGNGLQSVRTRVRDLGGEITISSETSPNGHGTTFVIRLPLLVEATGFEPSTLTAG